MEFTISPSNLTFLYNGCPRCFWLASHGGMKQPSIFPGVFNRIDSSMRKFFDGKQVQKFAPDLPAGVFKTKSRKVQTTPIMFGEVSLIIAGKTDAFVDFDRGKTGIIDFKCAGKLDDLAEKYARQLFGYALAAVADGLEVTHLGLIAYVPDTFDKTETPTGDPLAALYGRLTWIPIPRNDSEFMKFLAGVARLLAGPPPAVGPNCDYCRYIVARREEKDLFVE